MAIGTPHWFGNSGHLPGPKAQADVEKPAADSKAAKKAPEASKAEPADKLTRDTKSPLKAKATAKVAPAKRAEPANNGDLAEINRVVLATLRSSRA